MKHLLFSFLLICNALNAAVALSSDTAATNAQPDIGFTASVSVNSAEGMEPIILSVVVQNKFTNEIRIGLMEKYLDCAVTVRNEQGEGMPPTRYNQTLSKMTRRSGTYVRTLKPGETYTYKIPINLLYDMSVPGKYLVTAHVQVAFERDGEKASIDLQSQEQQVVVRRTIGSRE